MKITTKKGYGFFEVSSAFQKSIRRNDEDNAIYFGVELFNSGYDEYAWRRMKLICAEDIGLANPTLPANIHALYNFYQDQKKDKKENKPERMFYLQAVIMLCRSPKSRYVDWKLIAVWREHDTKHMDIPDYAFDMHNVKGKQMGRGIDHFYHQGTVLIPHEPVEGEGKAKADAYELHVLSPGKVKFDETKKGTLTQSQMNFE